MSTRARRVDVAAAGIAERVDECCWREMGGNGPTLYGYVCDYHEGYLEGAEDVARLRADIDILTQGAQDLTDEERQVHLDTQSSASGVPA